MTTLFLFPNSWKKVGWVLFIIPIIVFMYFWITETSMESILIIKVFALYDDQFLGEKGFFRIIENNIFDELLLITCLIGGLIVGFGRTKIEDEMVIAIRYESLVWATYFNIAFVILGTAFIYGVGYFYFMILSMISSLIFSFFVFKLSYIRFRKEEAMTNKIKVHRAMKDISQEQLAKTIGVSRQTINTMEKNKYVPSTVLALKIAKYFGVTVEEVFFLEETD